MRGSVAGVATAQPLGGTLPAVLGEDPLLQAFAAGLDDVTAPVHGVLDCLDAYLDPALAPPDFVDWLAHFVALDLDAAWDLEHRRRAVAGAATTWRMAGTVAGVRAHVELLTEGTATVLDTGGVATSTTPLGALPGDEVPAVAVRVVLPPGSVLTDRDVARAVRSATPVWVLSEVEVERS